MPAPFSSCWLQPWFLELKPIPRATYFYLALNPKISSVGVVHETVKSIASATYRTAASVTAAIVLLEEASAIAVDVAADDADDVFLVTAYASEVPPRLPADVLRWNADLDRITDGPFRDAVIAALIPTAVRLSEAQYKRIHPHVLWAIKAGR